LVNDAGRILAEGVVGGRTYVGRILAEGVVGGRTYVGRIWGIDIDAVEIDIETAVRSSLWLSLACNYLLESFSTFF
jgi:hypothetical protein